MYMMCALILLSVLFKCSIEGFVQLIHLSLSFTYIVIIKNKLDSFFPGGGRGGAQVYRSSNRGDNNSAVYSQHAAVQHTLPLGSMPELSCRKENERECVCVCVCVCLWLAFL